MYTIISSKAADVLKSIIPILPFSGSSLLLSVIRKNSASNLQLTKLPVCYKIFMEMKYSHEEHNIDLAISTI